MNKHSLMIILILLAPLLATAHGLNILVTQQPPLVMARAMYEGEVILPFAQVVVQSPDGQEFQNGRSDRLGRFVFFADQIGRWKLTVDDEMGHIQSVDIEVTQLTGTLAAVKDNDGPPSLLPRLLLGVGLILLLTSGLYLWKRRG